MFKKAVKINEPARIAISGASGSGKTFTALSLAQGMGERIVVIDTEAGASRKYADVFDFDIYVMAPPYNPQLLKSVLLQAESAGYDVCIVDGLSAFWNGEGGALMLVEQIARSKFQGNTGAAWSEVTPMQNEMLYSIVSSGMNVIYTMRSRQKHEATQDENGRMRLVKVGLAPYQRDGVEYEADLHLIMQMSNDAVVDKSRILGINPGDVIIRPDMTFGRDIKAKLSGSNDPDLIIDRQRELIALAINMTVNQLCIRVCKAGLADSVSDALRVMEDITGKSLELDMPVTKQGAIHTFDKIKIANLAANGYAGSANEEE